MAYRKSFLTVKQALDLKVIVPGLLTVLVAVLAIPSRVITASSYDGHSSLAAFFLQAVRQAVLPPGWRLIAVSPSEPLYVYLVASLFMSLLFGSPIIAFSVFELIIPRDVRGKQKKAAALTAIASVSLVCGAVLYGCYFVAPYFLVVSTPTFLNSIFLFPPTIDSAFFFYTAFKAMALAGLSFTMPVYIGATVYFRRQKTGAQ